MISLVKKMRTGPQADRTAYSKHRIFGAEYYKFTVWASSTTVSQTCSNTEQFLFFFFFLINIARRNLYLFIFLIFRATPAAYGGSQARDQIGAAAASLHHSHSHTISEPHLQPTPQLTATPDT